MDKQKLNKKLAEWAGIKPVPMEKINWNRPTTIIEEVPNFTQSLDACFKWLVPKFQPEVIKIIPVTGVKKYGDYGQKWGCIITPKEWGNNTSVIAEENTNPALALCLAIEKLIDVGT